MDQFDIQEGQVRSSYTRLDQQPSISSLSQIHSQKMDVVYHLLQAIIGSYILTFGIIASNGNLLTLLLIMGLSILITHKPTVFNPAVTLMESLQGLITPSQLWSSIFGQLVGSILGAMTAYFFLSEWDLTLPYFEATLHNSIIAQLYGEILGSTIFMSLILIQEDDYLRFTDDHLEHAGLISLAFGAARQLSYKCNSMFNPALAFSLELFECIKDQDWSRLGFIWIFLLGPFLGCMLALIFVNQIYRTLYDRKVKNGL